MQKPLVLPYLLFQQVEYLFVGENLDLALIICLHKCEHEEALIPTDIQYKQKIIHLQGKKSDLKSFVQFLYSW